MCGSGHQGGQCERGHHAASVTSRTDCASDCQGQETGHSYGDCGCGQHATGGCCCGDGGGIRAIGQEPAAQYKV